MAFNVGQNIRRAPSSRASISLKQLNFLRLAKKGDFLTNFDIYYQIDESQSAIPFISALRRLYMRQRDNASEI